MKRYICLLLAMLFLLAGCQEEEQLVVDPSITESLVMEAPQLNHGVLEYEKLKVEPWYCGRLEFTGGGCWAETENGYYYYDSGTAILKYADKTDLSKWVPVCSKPNCLHTENIRDCHARLGGSTFQIRNGRICFATSSGGKNEVLYLEEGDARLIASRALDGTDLRMAYHIEDAVTPNGGMVSDLLTPEFWMLNVSIFNPDGTYTNRCYRRTADALELVAETITQEKKPYTVGTYTLVGGMAWFLCPGETAFSNTLLSEVRGDPESAIYRYINGNLERVEMEEYMMEARYLSGNTLRLYRQNDGFYDLDLTTRQETKVVDAQLPDAGGSVLLPNFIVQRNKAHFLIFDGESWREVQIPEELKGESISTEAVASDRILLIGSAYPSTVKKLYQIRLDQEIWTVEYCGRIS